MHADVIGARLNSAVISDRGLEAEFFHLPTYSGHFHSPQTLKRVTYIGSPFETSLSEAGDQKRMLAFGPDWTRLPDLPLRYGPRHAKVTSATTPERKRRLGFH